MRRNRSDGNEETENQRRERLIRARRRSSIFGRQEDRLRERLEMEEHFAKIARNHEALLKSVEERLLRLEDSDREEDKDDDKRFIPGKK